MKEQSRKTLSLKLAGFAVVALAIASLAAFTTACSKSVGGANNSNNNGAADPTSPTSTTVVVPTQTVLDGTGGAQAPLTLNSLTALNEYLVGGSAANLDAVSAAVGVNLVKLATLSNGAGGYDYEFGGAVTIAFTGIDGGGPTYVEDYNSHMQGNPNTVNSDVQNNEYNLVSVQYPASGSYPGQLPAYHGFFQSLTYCIMGNGSSTYALSPGQPCDGEMVGSAVILVMDQMGFNADGEGATTASGSVWFYNFTTGNGAAPLPDTSCWFSTLVPYQCGSFFNGGDSIQTKSSLYPTVTYLPDGSTVTYTELGTFTGMNLNEALNGQLP